MTTRIVDAHHHIWLRDRTPWLAGPMVPRIFGEYQGIRRDYLIEEYADDATQHGVVASIHVQANVAAGEALGEVQWASESGRRHGLVQAVVAYADLAGQQPAAALVRSPRPIAHQQE